MATETTYRVDDSYDMSVVSSIDTMYVLEDGYLLPTVVEDAYCRQCKSIELVEVIPSHNALQIEFTDDDRRLITEGKPRTDFHSVVVERQRRLDWLRTRTSPPRCLYCGSSDYFVLDLKNASIDPLTGMRFVWVNGVFFDANYSLAIRLRPDGTVLTTWRPRFH